MNYLNFDSISFGLPILEDIISIVLPLKDFILDKIVRKFVIDPIFTNFSDELSNKRNLANKQDVRMIEELEFNGITLSSGLKAFFEADEANFYSSFGKKPNFFQNSHTFQFWLHESALGSLVRNLKPEFKLSNFTYFNSSILNHDNIS